MRSIIIAGIFSLLIHVMILTIEYKSDIIIKTQEIPVTFNIVEKENEYDDDDWGMKDAIKDANEMYPCLRRKKNG